MFLLPHALAGIFLQINIGLCLYLCFADGIEIAQRTSLNTLERACGYVPTKVTNPGLKPEACTNAVPNRPQHASGFPLTDEEMPF